MTPEERFTKIENFLATVAEHQADQAEIKSQHATRMSQHAEQMSQHAEQMRELREMHKGVVVAIGKIAEYQRSASEVQRILDEKMAALADVQHSTEEKLNA